MLLALNKFYIGGAFDLGLAREFYPNGLIESLAKITTKDFVDGHFIERVAPFVFHASPREHLCRAILYELNGDDVTLACVECLERLFGDELDIFEATDTICAAVVGERVVLERDQLRQLVARVKLVEQAVKCVLDLTQ